MGLENEQDIDVSGLNHHYNDHKHCIKVTKPRKILNFSLGGTPHRVKLNIILHGKVTMMMMIIIMITMV